MLIKSLLFLSCSCLLVALQIHTDAVRIKVSVGFTHFAQDLVELLVERDLQTLGKPAKSGLILSG